jgi:hypothetical protein
MSTQHWFARNAPKYIETPAYVNSNVTQILTGNTVNVALPPGSTPGNLFVMFVGGNLTSTSFTGITCAGWIKIAEILSGVPGAVFYKKVVAGEPVSYPASLDGTGVNAVNVLWRVLEFSGVNADNPIHFIQQQGPNNTTSMFTSPIDIGYKGILVSHTGHAGSTLYSCVWNSGLPNDVFIGSTVRTHVALRFVTSPSLAEFPLWTGGAAVSMEVFTLLIRAKTIYH